MINVRHRRTIRQPVHLTHESTQQLFERLHVPAPWTQLKRQNQHLQHCCLCPDPGLSHQPLGHAGSNSASLNLQAGRPLKVRCVHGIPRNQEYLYNPLLDAWNGASTCAHCDKPLVFVTAFTNESELDLILLRR